jgi:DNA N-6-adenine-methyltransferase (Dam)
VSAGRKINTLSQDWGTPEKYVQAIKEFFGGEIDLDPCSNQFSIVGARVQYMLPEQDGLKAGWNFKRIYVNPPYGLDRKRGTGIKSWLCRCAQAHKNFGSEVLALVPVATNTGHWKKHVFGKAIAVCFLYDTRLKFLVNGQNGGKGAPMSCAMIYWGTSPDQFRSVFEKFGAVLGLQELQQPGVAWGLGAPQLELVSEF